MIRISGLDVAMAQAAFPERKKNKQRCVNFLLLLLTAALYTLEMGQGKVT